jgi:hypothetical protein
MAFPARALLLLLFACAACSQNVTGITATFLATTTATENSTLTLTEYASTTTQTVTANPVSTSSDTTAPSPMADYEYFTAFAYRVGSPIHGLRIEAAGSGFHLGGLPATYCPESVEEDDDCPPGNYTSFSSCSMVSQSSRRYLLPNHLTNLARDGAWRPTNLRSPIWLGGLHPAAFSISANGKSSLPFRALSRGGRSIWSAQGKRFWRTGIGSMSHT